MAVEFNAKGGLSTPHIIVSGDDKSAIEFKTNKTDFLVSNTVINNTKVLDVSMSGLDTPSVILTTAGVGSHMVMNGNNIAVLNNAAGKIYFSTNNGQTFSQFNLPSGLGIWGDIEYINGRYVISGEKAVRSTTDFVTWTSPAFPGLVGTPPCWTLSVANGILFVSFANNFIYRSTDGITFTGGQRQPTSQYINFYRVIHDGIRYVSAGNIAAPQATYTSTDGITWAAQGQAPENQKVLNTVAYFAKNKMYYTITETGNAYSSTDLQTWSRLLTVPNTIGVGAYSDSSVMMITTTNGMVYYTFDGAKWETIQLSSSSVYSVMAYGKEYLASTGPELKRFAISEIGSTLLQLSADGITTGQPQSTLPNSLTRKDYVDAQVKTIADAQVKMADLDAKYLPLSGGTLTGELIVKNSVSKITFDHATLKNQFNSTITGIAFDVNSDTVAKATAEGMISFKPQSANVAALTRRDYVDGKFTSNKTELDALLLEYAKTSGATMTGDLNFNKLSSIKLVDGDKTNFTISQHVDGAGLANLEFIAGATGATSTIVHKTNSVSVGGINYGNGVAVIASASYVAASIDGGKTWARNNSADFVSSTFKPYMVSFVNNRWFISENAALYTSTDGVNWVKTTAPAGQYFQAAYINSQYIVGTSNGIVKSPDAVTWTKQTISTSPSRQYYAVYAVGNIAVVSGIGGFCYTSTDGNAWTARAAIATVDITRIAYADEEWFAFGLDRTMYNSSNNGLTWTKISNPSTLDGQSHGIAASSDYLIAGYGPNGTYFVSFDYGKTWKSNKVTDTSFVVSLAQIDASNALLLTNAGNVHQINLGKSGSTPLKVTVDGAFTDTPQSMANNALVRKDYVDSVGSAFVKKTGDSISGTIRFDSANDNPIYINCLDDGPSYITFARNDIQKHHIRHSAGGNLEFLARLSDVTADGWNTPLFMNKDGIYTGLPQGTVAHSLVRKDYTDLQDDKRVAKIGDTMTGSLTLKYAAPVMSFIETDNADKKWAFAADGGTFRIHEDSTGITDPEVVLMVTLDKKTAIRNPTSRNAQGTTADSLVRKDYADGKIAKSGDTMTGVLNMNVADSMGVGKYSISMNNGSIGGLNSIAFGDPTEFNGEGIFFPKEGKTNASTNQSDYDVVRAYNGDLFFNNQKTYGEWNKPTALDLSVMGINITTLSVDLNTLGSTASAGVYRQEQNVAATVANNYPVQLAGTLVVTPSAYGCQQEYTTFTGQKFIRGLSTAWNGTNGPWREWTTLVQMSKDIISMPTGPMAGLQWINALSYMKDNADAPTDGAAITYDNDYAGTNQDHLVFTKFDGNDIGPDGGIVFNWRTKTTATQIPPSTILKGEYIRMTRDKVIMNSPTTITDVDAVLSNPATLKVEGTKSAPTVVIVNSGTAQQALSVTNNSTGTNSHGVARFIQAGVKNPGAVVRTFITDAPADLHADSSHIQCTVNGVDFNTPGAVSVFRVAGDGTVKTEGTVIVKGQEVFHPGNLPPTTSLGALPTAGGMMTGAINFALPGTATSYGSLSAQTLANKILLTSVANVVVQADNDNKNTNETLMLAAGLNQLIVGSGAAAKTNALTYNGNKVYHAGDNPTWLDVKAVGDYQEVLTSDLDTVNGQGVYFQDANVNSTAAKHYPVQLAGTLFVTRSAYGLQQEYTSYNGRKFQRGLTGNWNGTNGPWGAWTEFWSEVTPAATIPFVMKAGDTLTGSLTAPDFIQSTAQTNNPAASTRKDYVDAQVKAIDDKNVSKVGDTLTGALIAASIPNAIQIKGKGSVSYQDGASTRFHTYAETNFFKISHGNDPTTNILAIDPAGNMSVKGSLTAPDFIQTTPQTNNAAASTRKDYVDGEIAKCLPKAGGTLTGDVIISNDSEISWSRNTDFARISFKNTGDTDADSYMHFITGDNGNEYFKWSFTESSTIINPMNLKKDGLYVTKLDADIVRQNGVSLDCNIQNLNIGGVASNITTAQFIDIIKAQGAFVNRHWIGKTFWTYAANAVIIDTGIGNLNLTGCVIEVFSQSATSAGDAAAYIIRVTTPTTAPSGTPSSQFTYVNHGSAYAPGWRREYNTANPPPAGTGSDIKLKKDVTPIVNALEKVNALRGVEYNLKKDNTHHCGFIAQEVEKVIPEAVHTDVDGETKLVEYGNIVAYMAEAIKTLTSQVQTLTAEVERLKKI